MRVFLTGGTGFVGSHFLNHAVNCGHDITAIKRYSSSPKIKLLKEPVWKRGSLDSNWKKELSVSDVLIHFASHGVLEGSNDWVNCFKTNVEKSLNLWLQAIEAGVKRLIILGSCAEYGLSALNYKYIPSNAPLIPTTAYGASKAAATMAAISLCIEHPIEVIILRPNYIYGRGQSELGFWGSLSKAALNDEDFKMTKGEQIRDFQSVQDTVRIIETYVSREIEMGKPLINNIGSGCEKTLLEFAEEQWKFLNAKGNIIPGAIPYRNNEIMRYVPLL
ncbi:MULTISPECIES: NAD-dependent epimerase/dehydratase family protein [unclassified Prochlorococcus]|uniref:NAD-dependent epimerase/dehydratase family protein n=1 Tax=unclassified Prochlorococcus TaxID=2627481 RepID=UPI000533B8DC|nr:MULTISPECIES: NAD(P)-dependent oxidoreductase [unclassified Prochlorococcus]KGG16342.1 UDP-glucose 4-epimerase [Prochlorococcus sp. MIT 0603]KGG17924.1 UDP-glucose 4-epimerase [Prochlorococcus sp. MIT 0602]